MDIRTFEGSTVSFWLSRIRRMTFKENRGIWGVTCGRCGKSIRGDTHEKYYQFYYPHGLDNKRKWKGFCSSNCANKWVREWFTREAEERKAILEQKKREKLVTEEDIKNQIMEAIAAWDGYFYRNKIYIDHIFSDALTSNDRNVLIWLALMWGRQEYKAFKVEWEACMESLGVSEEEKDQSLKNLVSKGWVKINDESYLTLHIPRKIYWSILE